METAKKNDSRIGLVALVAAGIVLKQCPITSGRPTRMTAHSFTRACELQRRDGLKYTYNFGKTKVRNIGTWCDRCKGRRPDELEIIPVADIRALTRHRQQQPAIVPGAPGITKPKERGTIMPVKRVVGDCECCGTNGSLSICSGDMVCSTCASLYGTINRRKEVLIRAVKKLQPHLLAEFSAHDAEQLATDRADTKADLEALASLRESLGIDHTYDLVTTIADFSQGFDRYKKRSEELVVENTILADRVSVLERSQEWVEQHRQQIGEALGNPEVPLGDISAVVRSLFVMPPPGTLPGGNFASLRVAAPNIDSHLLDLVIDYPGIPLERIALLREAV